MGSFTDYTSQSILWGQRVEGRQDGRNMQHNGRLRKNHENLGQNFLREETEVTGW